MLTPAALGTTAGSDRRHPKRDCVTPLALDAPKAKKQKTHQSVRPNFLVQDSSFVIESGMVGRYRVWS